MHCSPLIVAHAVTIPAGFIVVESKTVYAGAVLAVAWFVVGAFYMCFSTRDCHPTLETST